MHMSREAQQNRVSTEKRTTFDGVLGCTGDTKRTLISVKGSRGSLSGD